MKKVLAFILALTTTYNIAYSQCPTLPDTIFNCGFEFTTNFENDFVETFYSCEMGDGIIDVDFSFPNYSITFSNCGYYTVVIFAEGCEEELVVFKIEDPSSTEYNINNESSFGYNNIICAQGGSSCDNQVSAPGGLLFPPEWDICSILDCSFEHFSTIVTPAEPVECVADEIEVLSITGSDNSIACVNGLQDMFVDIDPNSGEIDNDFLDFIDSLSAEILNSGGCPLAPSGCFDIPDSCIDSITEDTILIPFPIHTGGGWKLIEDSDTIVMQDTTPVNRDGLDLLLVIEPGADYYGPDQLNFTLLEVLGNDTLPAYYDYTFILYWQEYFVYDTLEYIELVYHYADDTECEPCGGNSISKNFNVPPAPEFPCPPISISFGSPCTCIDGEIIVTGDTEICPGECVTLTADINSSFNYTDPIWFKNGVQVGTSSVITVCSGGVYTAQAFEVEFGCPLEISVDVIEVDAPVIIVEDAFIDCFNPCVEILPELQNTQSDVELFCYFPNGEELPEGDPICEETEIFIQAIDLNTGCSSSEIAQVIDISEDPIINIPFPGNLSCAQNCIDIIPDVGSDLSGFEIFWSGPNGYFSDQLEISACEPGEYFLDVFSVNCSATSSIIIDEIVTPVDINLQETICDGDCIIFKGQTYCDPGQYIIEAPCDSTFIFDLLVETANQEFEYYEICDGESIEIDGVEYDSEVITTYDVDNGNICPTVKTLEIDLFYLDLALDGDSEITCEQTEASITAYSSNDINNFIWTDASNNIVGTGSTITVNEPGVYVCTNNSPNMNCNSSIAIAIDDFTEEPEILFDPVLVLNCENEIVLNIDVTDDQNLTYTWNGPGISETNYQDKTPLVSEAGMYTVLVENEFGCLSTAAIEVIGIQALENKFESSKSCSNSNTGIIKVDYIQGGSGPFKYNINGSEWQDEAKFVNLAKGVYEIGILENDGCDHYEDVEVEEILPLEPTIEIRDVYDFCSTPVVEFDLTDELANNPGWNFSWNDGYSGINRTIENTGEYMLQLNNVCEVREYEINVIDNRVDEDEVLYVPNIFTPNNDGINDYFTCSANEHVESFEIAIYDRWGSRVFYSEDIEFSWNGHVKNDGGKQGVFAYIVKYSVSECDSKAKSKVKYGDVTILR